MKQEKRNSERARRPPFISFPGGRVQMVNPRHPIKDVWSDLLHLEPNGKLPAHIHERTSSLLICISGSGVISVAGKRTPLRKGICVYIPSGSEHFVKAGRNCSLVCLSVNQGIIEPGSGTDISFTGRQSAAVAATWANFASECAKTAAEFQEELRRSKHDWAAFTLDIDD